MSNFTKYLRFCLGQIQRYTAFDNITKSYVAKESHHSVQDNHSYHSSVQDSWTAKEMLGFLHGILHWHHNANSFHCKDHSAAEEISHSIRAKKKKSTLNKASRAISNYSIISPSWSICQWANGISSVKSNIKCFGSVLFHSFIIHRPRCVIEIISSLSFS